METTLPACPRLLAVCAHPDDESFGLGAVLAAFAAAGTHTSVLCFTQGEASRLGPATGDLAMLRAQELATAAAVLGVAHVELLAYPDGGLGAVPLTELSAHVERLAAPDATLLVFDEGGITGHRDHQRATQAALVSADRMALPVFAWALPLAVAEALNAEFGATFVGRAETALAIGLRVDRTRQLRAIACHHSQSTENPVLWRRLQLQGEREYLRTLRPGRPRDRLGAGNGAVAQHGHL